MKKKNIIITVAAALAAGAAGFGIYAVNNMLPAEAAATEYTADRMILSEGTKPEETESMLAEIIGTGYMDMAAADEGTEQPAETGSITGNTEPDADTPDGDKEDNKPSGTVTGNTAGGSSGTGAAAGDTGSGTGTQISGNGSSSTPAAPASTTGSAAGTESGNGNHAGQTWHEPVYENVWVVDEEAWTETYPVYETRVRIVCYGCGCYMYTQDEVSNHPCLAGYYDETYQVQVGTETESHPEVGHWEQKLVKDGYWE